MDLVQLSATPGVEFAIPPPTPPSFEDIKFSIIGRPPTLYERMFGKPFSNRDDPLPAEELVESHSPTILPELPLALEITPLPLSDSDGDQVMQEASSIADPTSQPDKTEANSVIDVIMAEEPIPSGPPNEEPHQSPPTKTTELSANDLPTTTISTSLEDFFAQFQREQDEWARLATELRLRNKVVNAMTEKQAPQPDAQKTIESPSSLQRPPPITSPKAKQPAKSQVATESIFSVSSCSITDGVPPGNVDGPLHVTNTLSHADSLDQRPVTPQPQSIQAPPTLSPGSAQATQAVSSTAPFSPSLPSLTVSPRISSSIQPYQHADQPQITRQSSVLAEPMRRFDPKPNSLATNAVHFNHESGRGEQSAVIGPSVDARTDITLSKKRARSPPPQHSEIVPRKKERREPADMDVTSKWQPNPNYPRHWDHYSPPPVPEHGRRYDGVRAITENTRHSTQESGSFYEPGRGARPSHAEGAYQPTKHYPARPLRRSRSRSRSMSPPALTRNPDRHRIYSERPWSQSSAGCDPSRRRDYPNNYRPSELDTLRDESRPMLPAPRNFNAITHLAGPLPADNISPSRIPYPPLDGARTPPRVTEYHDAYPKEETSQQARVPHPAPHQTMPLKDVVSLKHSSDPHHPASTPADNDRKKPRDPHDLQRPISTIQAPVKIIHPEEPASSSRLQPIAPEIRKPSDKLGRAPPNGPRALQDMPSQAQLSSSHSNPHPEMKAKPSEPRSGPVLAETQPSGLEAPVASTHIGATPQRVVTTSPALNVVRHVNMKVQPSLPNHTPPMDQDVPIKQEPPSPSLIKQETPPHSLAGDPRRVLTSPVAPLNLGDRQPVETSYDSLPSNKSLVERLNTTAFPVPSHSPSLPERLSKRAKRAAPPSYHGHDTRGVSPDTAPAPAPRGGYPARGGGRGGGPGRGGNSSSRKTLLDRLGGSGNQPF